MDVNYTSNGSYFISGDRLYPTFVHNQSIAHVNISTTFPKIPSYCFYDCTNLQTVYICTCITKICRNAFSYCRNLQNITFPYSVEYIDQSAFIECHGLTHIKFPLNLKVISKYAFFNCSNLITIEFQRNFELIDFMAFTYCVNLTSVKLNYNIKSIGYMAFSTCISLSDIHFPEKNSYIGDRAFEYCIKLIDIEIQKCVTSLGYITFPIFNVSTRFIIPSHVKDLSDYAFIYSNITSLIVPETVSAIRGSAFSQSKLVDLQIENSSIHLEGDVFGFSDFQEIKFPNGIKELSSKCFYFAKIEHLEISTKIQKIGNEAFYFCSYLKKLSIHSDSEFLEIGENIFNWCNVKEVNITGKNIYIGKNEINIYSCVLSINASSSVSIGNLTIKALSSLEIIAPATNKFRILLPNTISSIKNAKIFYFNFIPDYCFSNWEILTEITETDFITSSWYARTIPIPNNINKIGRSAFQYCKNLQKVVLSDKINYICENAFAKCERLTYFEFKSSSTIVENYTLPILTNQNLKIKIPQNNNKIIAAFQYYKNNALTSFQVQDDIEEIHNAAFAYSSLENIILNEKIKSIPEFCFYCCSNLAQINFQVIRNISNLVVSAFIIGNYSFYYTPINRLELTNDVHSIGAYSFAFSNINELILSSSLETIATYSFLNSNFQTLNIPPRIKILEDGSFSNCLLLKTINSLINIEYIGDNTFENCINLTSFNITTNNNLNSLYSFGSNSFANCYSLRSINLPKHMKNIGNNVFRNCINLETISFPNNISYIGKEIFNNCSISQLTLNFNSNNITIDESAFAKTKVEKLNISAKSISIGFNSFLECHYLLEVIIDSETGSISQNAFYNCSSLSNVDFMQSKLTLNFNSFYNTNISYLKFNNICSVYSPFYNCKNLREVQFKETIDEAPKFVNCSNLKIIRYEAVNCSFSFIESCITIPSLEKVYFKLIRFTDELFHSQMVLDFQEEFKFEMYYVGSEKTDYIFDHYISYFIFHNQIKVHVPDSYMINTFCGVDVIRDYNPNMKRRNRKRNIRGLKYEVNALSICDIEYYEKMKTVLPLRDIITIFSNNLITHIK